MTRSLFSSGGSAGAWGILHMVFEMDDPVAVFFGRQRWPVERPKKSFWNLSPFAAGGSAGAWSVLRILLGIYDPLAVSC